MIDNKKLNIARVWIEKLANGVNPLTDEMVNEGDVLNNVHISRCLFYVSELLEKMEHLHAQSPKKKAFWLSANEAKGITIEQSDGINNFVKKVNECIPKDMKTLTSIQVIRWLRCEGYMQEVEREVGHRTNLPTTKGNNIGISTITQQNSEGTMYTRVVYNVEAQQFILNNIEAIASHKES